MDRIKRRKDYLYICYGYHRSTRLNKQIEFNDIKRVLIDNYDTKECYVLILYGDGQFGQHIYAIKASTQLQAEEYRDLINKFTSEWHQKQLDKYFLYN